MCIVSDFSLPFLILIEMVLKFDILLYDMIYFVLWVWIDDRSPLKQLGCLQSFLPLHSAVATARLTSCLNDGSRSCRALSQGTLCCTFPGLSGFVILIVSSCFTFDTLYFWKVYCDGHASRFNQLSLFHFVYRNCNSSTETMWSIGRKHRRGDGKYLHW